MAKPSTLKFCPPGTERVIRGRKEIIVKAGNAGGIDFRFNGKKLDTARTNLAKSDHYFWSWGSGAERSPCRPRRHKFSFFLFFRLPLALHRSMADWLPLNV